MLFDDLTCSESEFQRVGIATEKHESQYEFQPWEQTTSENQMLRSLGLGAKESM